MNSYLMRLTQFMLLRERKCNESAEISKLRRWEFFYTGKEWKSRCDFCCCCCFFPCCSLQEPDDFHVIFTKPLFFYLCHQYSCSIHSKRWDSIHSKSITAQWLTTAPFYNHTITIFMRTPADGKTISLSPPTPPHLSLSPLFFCGPHSFLWAYFNEKFGGESLRDLPGLVISPTRWRE